MMQGWAEPSSTLQPLALAIVAHSITDPIGANANATITKSASKYKTQGNLFGLFTIAIGYHRSRVNAFRFFRSGRQPRFNVSNYCACWTILCF